MAKFRQVHTTFWDDAFVLDLTPEEKYFYLYLMTNDKTTQCGIYELPKRVIEMHTGYNRETVDKLLERFTEYGKITYYEPTKEIMLNNWAKYNFINSPKVKKCIEKELEKVKHQGFVKQYLVSLSKYGYRIDTVSIDLGEEEEKEEEEEIEKEEEQQGEGEEKKSPASANPFEFYQAEGFGVVGPHIAEKLNYWSTDLSDELVIASMKLAVERGKKSWSYCEAILKGWTEKGIKTIEAARAEQKAFIEQQMRKRGSYNRKPVRNEKLPEWFEGDKKTQSAVGTVEEDDYDFEAEKAKLEEELKAFRK
jgi:DnaD/phage-associated family protein